MTVSILSRQELKISRRIQKIRKLFSDSTAYFLKLYTSIITFLIIPAAGVEPARPQRALDFESSASANSATPAS